MTWQQPGPEVLQGPLKAALANEAESSESPAALSAVKRAEDSSAQSDSRWGLLHTGWWFGTFLFSQILGIIIPID